jgi:alkylmercury lyase
MMSAPPISLDTLAATFPAADDAPLARTLLALLARGDPVTDHQLADETKRPTGDVRAALARWPNVHRDGRGAVVAFAGLSLRATEHRLMVGGRVLFTWCAWDTLFMPALLEHPAEVRSTCPATKVPIQVQVGADGITFAEPAELSVSFPPLADVSTAAIVESFCCHVHFIAGRDTAQRWLSEHPGARVLALDDAYELGQRATTCLRAPSPSASGCCSRRTR